ncbi:MAG: hypothetical protein ACSHW0_12200 [Thalassotalea sp.]
MSRGEDAAIQNFSELVLREAYQQIGYQLTVIHVPIARSLILANSGKLDGDVSRVAGVEKQYPQLIKIPVPINHIDVRMFTYNQALLVNSAEIDGRYRIGCVRGVISVRQISKKMKLDCQIINSYQRAIIMLNNNSVDVLLLPLSVGEYFKDIDAQFATSVYGDSLGIEPLFHYLHKKHQQFVPELTVKLQEMKININKKTYEPVKN